MKPIQFETGLPPVPGRETNAHSLKCWPPFFGEINTGSKKFELRRNDRNYKVGDVVVLNEYIPDSKEFTGRSVLCTITSIISKENMCPEWREALHPDFCIFSIEIIQ